MFGTIRKHQTWLWVFLVAVMSLGLFFFFTPDAFQDRGGTPGKVDLGSINGRPIERSEYMEAWKEIRIASFLHTGKWPGSDESSNRRMESETISRVFILQKLREMDIRASDRAVALMMHEQLREYPFETLAKEILQPNELTLADYERYVRNEAAIRQLISAASVSARLVSPAEAETLWRKENQEMVGQVACFWASNFLSKVVITNGAIGAFYTNRMNVSYRIPDRITISYVGFPSSNYLADADSRLAKLTNLNEIVSDYYFRGNRTGTNAWTDTNGVPLAEAAAKEKIREEIRQNEALIAARRAANEFGNELITQTNANDVANLDRLAAAKGLKVLVTAPFVPRPFGSWTNDLEEFDRDLVPGSRSDDTAPEALRDVIRQRAAALTDERPIHFSPLLGKHGIYIIAKKGKVPSETQPLEKIVDKVTTDYKNFMALDLVRKTALPFHTNLTNTLKLKTKTFTEMCAAEQLPVLNVPPFSLSAMSLTNLDPRINLRQIQSVADGMAVGSASSFMSAMPPSEGGYIFYLADRPTIEMAKLKAELPDFINRMRTMRQNEAFQQWFRKQAEQAKLAGPKRETSIGAQN